MPNPTDTLYAPPLPPLGKSPLYFDDVVAKQPSPSAEGYASFQALKPKVRPIVRTVGEDEARGELLRTIVNNPRRVNPRSVSGGCVNTSLTHDGHHCVAAQVAKNLGLPLPSTDCGENTGGFPTLADWLRKTYGVNFTHDAIELLQRAQGAADADSTSTEPEGWLVAVGREIARRRSY